MEVHDSTLKFSQDLYRLAWMEYFKDSNVEILSFGPMTINLTDEQTVSSCSYWCYKALEVRETFFEKSITLRLFDYYEYYYNFEMDYYLFLKGKLSEFLPDENMIVFDKILMIAAVIFHMSMHCENRARFQYFIEAPKTLALYIETELKREFCDSGGWFELERYSKRYKTILLSPYHLYYSIDEHESESNFIKDLFKDAHYIYDLEKVVSTFYNRFDLEIKKKKVCLRCQPYAYALCYCKFQRCNLVGFQLVECFIQLFLQTPSPEELLHSMGVKENISEIDWTTMNLDNLFESYKDQNTNAYIDRLFPGVKAKFPTSCLFCSKSVNCPNKLKTIPKELIDLNIAMYKAFRETKKQISIPGGQNTGFDPPELNHWRRLFCTLGTKVTESTLFLNQSKKRMKEEREKLKRDNESCRMQDAWGIQAENKSVNKSKKKR